VGRHKRAAVYSSKHCWAGPTVLGSLPSGAAQTPSLLDQIFRCPVASRKRVQDDRSRRRRGWFGLQPLSGLRAETGAQRASTARTTASPDSAANPAVGVGSSCTAIVSGQHADLLSDDEYAAAAVSDPNSAERRCGQGSDHSGLRYAGHVYRSATELGARSGLG
jgi:hypothetical protein